jgi:hypothetical protein
MNRRDFLCGTVGCVLVSGCLREGDTGDTGNETSVREGTGRGERNATESNRRRDSDEESKSLTESDTQYEIALPNIDGYSVRGGYSFSYTDIDTMPAGFYPGRTFRSTYSEGDGVAEQGSVVGIRGPTDVTVRFLPNSDSFEDVVAGLGSEGTRSGNYSGYELYEIDGQEVATIEETKTVVYTPDEDVIGQVVDTLTGEADPVTSSNESLDLLVKAIGGGDAAIGGIGTPVHISEEAENVPGYLDNGEAFGVSFSWGDEEVGLRYAMVYPDSDSVEPVRLRSFVESAYDGGTGDVELTTFERTVVVEATVDSSILSNSDTMALLGEDPGGSGTLEVDEAEGGETRDDRERPEEPQ